VSDFVSTLEGDLLDAAARLQDRSRQTERQSRRARSYRLLGAGVAVLVVAAPALAGVPGVWRGILTPRAAPTLTTRPPEEQLLAELGALRRPAVPADRSPEAMMAVRRSGPLTAVSISHVRYVGVSPIGDPLYLVPYRSRVRLLAPPREAPGEAPAGKVMFNGHPPTRAARTRLGPPRAGGKHLREFLNRPGVCLIGVAAVTPEIADCAGAGEIAEGTDYATVGVYRTHPQEPGAPPPQPGTGHVVASIASGLVPDHVASVRLAFSSGNSVSVLVRGNYFAFVTGRGEGGVPAITWLAADGHVLRRIPAR